MSWEIERQKQQFHQQFDAILCNFHREWWKMHGLQVLQLELGDINAVSVDTLKRWAGRDSSAIPQSQKWEKFIGAINSDQHYIFETVNDLLIQIRQDTVEGENPLYKDAMQVNGQWFFGINATIDELLNVLQTHRFICFSGMGGLGKTSKAEALIYHAIQQNIIQKEQIIRIEITHTDVKPLSLSSILDELIELLELDKSSNTYSEKIRISTIAKELQKRNRIFYIDNVHTKADYETLKPFIRTLIPDVQVLMTIRSEPTSDKYQRHTTLEELSLIDSICILLEDGLYREPSKQCKWMKKINIDSLLGDLRAGISLEDLVTHSSEEVTYLAKAVQLVGGNPKALELIAGQYKENEPLRILKSFETEQLLRKDTESMYRHIYRKLWLGLNEHEREILKVLSDAPIAGMNYDTIYMFINMMLSCSQTDTDKAIEGLSSKNLLRIRTKEIDQYVYSIHQLTYTFVRTDVSGLVTYGND